MTHAGQQLAVQGVYGWDSLDAHTKWSETEEWAEGMKAWEDVAEKTGAMTSSLAGSGIFHVEFGGFV